MSVPDLIGMPIVTGEARKFALLTRIFLTPGGEIVPCPPRRVVAYRESTARPAPDDGPPTYSQPTTRSRFWKFVRWQASVRLRWRARRQAPDDGALQPNKKRAPAGIPSATRTKAMIRKESRSALGATCASALTLGVSLAVCTLTATAGPADPSDPVREQPGCGGQVQVRRYGLCTPGERPMDTRDGARRRPQ